MSSHPIKIAGPAIRAVDPWLPGNPVRGERHQLLSDEERAQLAKISSIVRFKKGEMIYELNAPAEASFNIISGVVTAFRPLSRKREHITAFLYPGDLFGLSEQGCYVNSTRATTAVTAYRIPLQAMRRLLSRNADLDVDIIIKLCDELRQAQRHAFLLAQKRAVSKVAMLLDLHEHLQRANGLPASDVYLPMDRSAIAGYLGLSLPAVSRAFRTLTARKIISFRDRRHAQILDRKAFEHLADAPE
jgi:CRP-like cAMP-binding protein